MTEPKTFELAGHRWQCKPLDVDQQIIVEVTLINWFGAGASAMIASIVEGFAPTIVQVLRDSMGADEELKLPSLATLTADPRVKAIWDRLDDALGATLGEAVRTGIPEISDRLPPEAVKSMFRTVVLSRKTLVEVGGKWKDVTGWDALTRLLAPAGPRAKWELFGAVLAATYSAEPDEDEPDTDGGADA